MESKPNACCANCEYRCGNTYTESTPPCPVADAADKNDFKPFACAEYEGYGLTPQMEIIKLKKRLHDICYDIMHGGGLSESVLRLLKVEAEEILKELR